MSDKTELPPPKEIPEAAHPRGFRECLEVRRCRGPIRRESMLSGRRIWMAVLSITFVSLALFVAFEKEHHDGSKEALRATGSEEIPTKTTYYARVVGGVVTHILLSDPESIKTVPGGPDAKWIETVKTAEGGIRYDPGAVDSERKGMLRKNPAEVGFSYDEKLDCFIPFRPHKSWMFDKDTCRWNPPVAYPTDGKPYEWNEEKRKWVEVILPVPGTCSSRR